MLRLPWLLFQGESNLSKSLVAFAGVALLAAADKVFPACRTTQALRNDMVYRQVGSGVATVLAGIVVAGKDAASRELELRFRPFDVISESNHRRRNESPRHRAQDHGILVQDVYLTEEHEVYCPPHVADIERLIITI